ncbi:MAG: polyisoprenoid-binding protein [Alphaproteobacteria bacterium]|nr:polyisoprenoid-binding protein [Alphaproteobacteria bacterium]
MKSIILGTALIIAATPVLAQDAYELDPSHTQVVFSVDRFGFTTIFGSFMEAGGTVLLDTENPENSSVNAQVETASVFLGHPTRDQHVAGQHWLNAEAHPQLTFDSTRVSVTGENTAEVTGMLTLWGEAREVTFDVTLNQLGTDPATQRQAAGFTLTGTIDRSAWGHTTASALVGSEIGIRIEALAHLREDQ